MSPKRHDSSSIGGLSSKVYVFLAVRLHFDSDHGVDFSAPTCCQSATIVRPLFAFYCPLCFTKKIIMRYFATTHNKSRVSFSLCNVISVLCVIYHLVLICFLVLNLPCAMNGCICEFGIREGSYAYWRQTVRQLTCELT